MSRQVLNSSCLRFTFSCLFVYVQHISMFAGIRPHYPIRSRFDPGNMGWSLTSGRFTTYWTGHVDVIICFFLSVVNAFSISFCGMILRIVALGSLGIRGWTQTQGRCCRIFLESKLNPRIRQKGVTSLRLIPRVRLGFRVRQTRVDKEDMGQSLTLYRLVFPNSTTPHRTSK